LRVGTATASTRMTRMKAATLRSKLDFMLRPPGP
jgi:hypothetical protein